MWSGFCWETAACIVPKNRRKNRRATARNAYGGKQAQSWLAFVQLRTEPFGPRGKTNLARGALLTAQEDYSATSLSSDEWSNWRKTPMLELSSAKKRKSAAMLPLARACALRTTRTSLRRTSPTSLFPSSILAHLVSTLAIFEVKSNGTS
jgi:hypothetical protein